MKKILAMILTGVMVMGLVACGQSSDTTETATTEEATTEEASTEEADDTIKIAYTTMTLSSTYFTSVANGIESACEEMGWECTIQDPQMDAASQVSAIEDFILQGYDGIIISAVDSAAVVDVVAQAQEAGIKVIGSSTSIEGQDAFVSADEFDMGYTLGVAIGEWCAENVEGDIEGLTFGTINDPNVMIREEGMRAGFEEMYTDGEVTWINETGTIGGVDSDDGMANMEVILQSNPDINVVMGSNDSGILGAYEAAKAAGKDLSVMAFGGVDAVQEALDTIYAEKEAGDGSYVATVDITPFDHGVTDVEIMQTLFDGETYEDQIVIEACAVTWANIDEYFE